MAAVAKKNPGVPSAALQTRLRADAGHVTAFLDNLSLERGISTHTRSAYARDLSLLAASLEARSLTLLQADMDGIVRFLEECADQGAAPRTRARRAAAIRSFYRYATADGLCAIDPARLIPSPRMPRLLPKALSHADTERLLQADHDDATTPQGSNRLVLELLYGCGLRVSELAGLRCSDFDLDGGFVRVTGKGGKARSVPIGQSVRESLAAWLQHGRQQVRTPESGDTLLLTITGKPVSRMQLHAMVRACARRAGFSRSITPHTLRHTFATHLVKGGADLRAVQEMLGHASIDTTQIYTTLAEEHLHAAHKRFHPRS